MLILRLAAQLAVVANAPASAAACEAVDVTVQVRAAGQIVPSLIAPSLRPFDILRYSLSRVEYRADGAGLQAEYRLTLATDQAGLHAIPSFEARVGGQVARSAPLSLDVRPTRLRQRPSVVARARIDTGMLGSPRGPSVDTVFVGQQATYEVAVFLNQTARERLRRNPTFYPPEMQAMLAYDLAPPAATSRDRSQCFDALVYRRALFPLVAGRVVIPPAQLVYSTGLSPSSLFSREESHELQTDSVTIVAVEPPVASRPADFSGAVGSVRLETQLDSASSRVGGPMLFTVRVAGSGNVKLFPRPTVRVPWAGLVPADERVEVDSTSTRIGGSKEFDWVLTPRIAGEFDAPRVRYGYFDPARRRYDVAEAGGGRVRVRTGALAAADTGQAESTLGIRTRYTGRTWPPLQSRPEFWLVMALAPLPAIVGRMRRRTSRVRAAAPAADALRSLVVSPAGDPVSLRRQYVRGLALRLGCNPEDFTHPGALRRALRRAGVSEETAEDAERLMRQLDAAAYDRSTLLPAGAARDAAAVAQAVDAEALSRRELPLWIPVLAVACALSASALLAADPAANQFARGVSSYLREDFVTAQAAFAATAALEERSADAWANYGTAAWNVADTAAAVLGWRQAMALEPAASDVRERLDLVRELRPASPGWAPSLPRNGAVYAFAGLWLAAWLLAWIARRPHPWAARLPVPLATTALLVGVIAIEVETRVAGERIAIVRRSHSLSSDPALGMDRGASVGTGEMVKVVGRRGIWLRVEASDDRDGWLSSSDVFLLSERRPPRE